MPAFIDKLKQSKFARKFNEFALGKSTADEFEANNARMLEEKAREQSRQADALDEQNFYQNQVNQNTQYINQNTQYNYPNNYGYAQNANVQQGYGVQNNYAYQGHESYSADYYSNDYSGEEAQAAYDGQYEQGDENPNYSIDELGTSPWRKSVGSFFSTAKNSIVKFFTGKAPRQREAQRHAEGMRRERHIDEITQPVNPVQPKAQGPQMLGTQPHYPNNTDRAPQNSIPQERTPQTVFCVNIQNIHDCHHAIAQIVKPNACIIVTIPKLIDLFEVRRYVDMLLGACQVMNLTLSRLSGDNNYFIIWSSQSIDLRLDSVTSKIQQDLYSDSLSNMMSFNSALGAKDMGFGYQAQPYQNQPAGVDYFADFPPLYSEGQNGYASGMMN